MGVPSDGTPKTLILVFGDNHEPLEHTLQNKLFLVLAHSALLAPADVAAALGGLKAE